MDFARPPVASPGTRAVLAIMPLCKNFENEISGPESQLVGRDGCRPEELAGRTVGVGGEKLEIRAVKKWRLAGVSAEGGFVGKDWRFETERGGCFKNCARFF